MEIRNNAENLQTLLGVNPAASTHAQVSKQGTGAAGNGLGGDQATVSNLGREVSQAATGSDVRTDKVAAIQAALASGTYHVPAQAVAHKLVDSLLGAGSGSTSSATGTGAVSAN